MIIHFFLLAVLCATSPIQAGDNQPVKPFISDDILRFGYEPLFSTHYIEEVKTPNLQLPISKINAIKRAEYNKLQENSTSCIRRRKEELDVTLNLAVFIPQKENNTKQITSCNMVYASSCTKIHTIAQEIPASISNLDLLLPDSSILRHIQWIREIHVEMKKNGNTYDNKTVIKLIDNTNFEVSSDLSNVIIRHLAAHKNVPFTASGSDNAVTAVYRVRHV
jgi:hypothetical protein